MNFSVMSMLICVLVSRGCCEIVVGFVGAFSLKPNYFKESCLVFWCWILIGIIGFLFELIVLSKFNILLIFFIGISCET